MSEPQNDNVVTTLTRLDTVANVQLIVTDAQGSVIGCLGFGDNPLLAKVIKFNDDLDPSRGRPVDKNEFSLFPIGQDTYTVSREFVLSCRALMFSFKWDELSSYERILPIDAKYTFIVHY